MPMARLTKWTDGWTDEWIFFVVAQFSFSSQNFKSNLAGSLPREQFHRIQLALLIIQSIHTQARRHLKWSWYHVLSMYSLSKSTLKRHACSYKQHTKPPSHPPIRSNFGHVSKASTRTSQQHSLPQFIFVFLAYASVASSTVLGQGSRRDWRVLSSSIVKI